MPKPRRKQSDWRVTLMRRAQTAANAKYSIGGRIKRDHKPVTLAKSKS
jgi:hypothetical protein